MKDQQLIFELSSRGRRCVVLGGQDAHGSGLSTIPEKFTAVSGPDLPEISEVDLVRHYTNLSRRNFGVDNGFYPLGSCTMKYNPKINEDVASLEGFTKLHPLQDAAQCQGILSLLYSFEKYLCALFGFDAFTLQPAAGAHGELTAVLMVKKYFEHIGQTRRKKILIPDSAHGTNPSSAAIAGFQVSSIRSNDSGELDLEDLRRAAGDDTALLMLTNPNTLGLFDRNILEISKIVHNAGALFYMDGANSNAILGKVRPVDMGFDVAHLNLHKTFATPHGGGGPGSGPVGVVKKLVPFLPAPRILEKAGKYEIAEDGLELSAGRMMGFYGNISVIIKAYAYLRTLGAKGVSDVSGNAVLNANYIMKKLKDHYFLPYDRPCQHEFVLSAKWQKQKYDVRALDIAKRLIDYGFHPPTIYFPLIAEEAIMIEPTETESIETLNALISAMVSIAKECETDPSLVKNAPYSTPVSRLDEVKAVKDLNICYKG